MYDVIVVGGGVAGLSAALVLGRARRQVLVLDGGSPRNEPAEHAHGFLSRDGTPPLELLRVSREELQVYPSVEIREGEAVTASAVEGGFEVVLSGGEGLQARKLVLATGVTDVLPEIPGVRELWGRGVYHCPYCHGWEVRDRLWAMLGEPPMPFEGAALARGWTRELIVLPNGPSQMSAEEQERLRTLEVPIDERRVSRLEAGEDEVSVVFDDGSSLVAGAVFIAPPQVQRSGLAAALGCEVEVVGLITDGYVKVDGTFGETSVPGVYAAGDCAGPMQSLIVGTASGARAAYAINRALALDGASAVLAGAGAG